MIQRSFVLAATMLAFAAHAAPSLQTVTGIVGGAGTSCASFMPAPELAFFTFAPANVSLCGIAAAGYSGGYRTQSATAGVLTQHDSLAPVALGPPQTGAGFYSGTADARAQYGSLGAAAHSQISAPGTYGVTTALFDSTAAAIFADTLTVLSPLVVVTSPGTVRYRFEVEGSLSAPGAVAPATPGDTRVVLNLQHDGGRVSEVMNASVRRGETGLVSNRPPPAGWVTSTGSLSGGSTFFSLDEAIVWGQPWDLRLGLLAWSYGTADTLFHNTARLTGVQVFDSAGVEITDFSLLAASGTDYLHPVPEPAAAWLMAAGLCALRLCRMRGNSLSAQAK